MKKAKVQLLAPAQHELEEIILVYMELTGTASAKKLIVHGATDYPKLFKSI